MRPARREAKLAWKDWRSGKASAAAVSRLEAEHRHRAVPGLARGGRAAGFGA